MTNQPPEYMHCLNAREKDIERLVEESFTCCCTAKAGNAICASDLTLELIVVREFFVCEMLTYYIEMLQQDEKNLL